VIHSVAECATCRVTTCLENLEMSGNLKHVREMSGLGCDSLCRRVCYLQGDHLSGKPGNVREFETCQGNVRHFVNSQGIVMGMSGKKSCHGKVSQKCSLLVEYLRSYGYLVAFTVISSFVIIMKYFGT